MERILKEYEFGEPWRYSEKSLGIIVPILRHSKVDRNYIMLEEAGKQVVIDETGSIRKLMFTNNSGQNVFVRGFTMLKGQGTQSRVVKSGIVLPAGVIEEIPKTGISPIREGRPKPVKVPVQVNCIHSAGPIVGNTTLTCFGWDKGEGFGSPRDIEYSLLATHHDSDSQFATWRAVSDTRYQYSTPVYAMQSGGQVSFSSSDDLIKIQEELDDAKTNIDEIVSKVPQSKDQVGIVILDTKGVMGIEVFDSPISWKVYSKGAIKKYGDILAKEDEQGLFEPRIDKIEPIIKAFCKNLMKCERSTLFENKIAKTSALENREILAEITMLAGRMIHLLAARREESERPIQKPGRLSREQSLAWGGDTIDDETSSYTVSGDYPIVTSSFEDKVPRFQILKKNPRSYFKGKKAIDFLSSLERPKSWGELEKDLQTSTRTLSKRVSEAQMLGYTEKDSRANGKEVYKLTDRGKNELRLAKIFYQE